MFISEFNNEKIFKTLFEAAEGAESIQGSRHSSALVYRKQIVAVTTNSRKSHPLQRKFGGPDKIVLHSEIACLVKAINLHGTDFLKKCELYNLRLTVAGRVGLSKPCCSCQKAIDAFGIRRVFWT